MNSKLKKWIEETRSEQIFCGDAFFVLPPTEEAEQIRPLLPKLDRILEESLLLKDSVTTTAGLVAVADSGKPLFLKRTNNKGLRFTCRYLFRFARPFRAAMAATKLAEIGIRTPIPLAVGERRNGLILQSAYLMTSSRNDPHSVSRIILEIVDVPMTVKSFLVQAGPIMAKMHRNGLFHGDMKLSNFYYCGIWTPETEIGVWDLDGVRSFPGNVPDRYILRELARVTASLLDLAARNPNTPPEFFNEEALINDLFTAYETAGTLPKNAMDKVRELLRKRRKKAARTGKKHQAEHAV